MIAFVLFAACAAPAPSAAEVVPPAPPERTLTLAVPNDCPHLMVAEIFSEDGASDVTVACFDAYSNRTYLRNAKGPPVGIKNEPDVPTRLVVELVPRNELDDPFAGR
ncbi:hypothetical protein EBS80_01390 [bacterium]|nr:hypothetical protein [bacterium]